MSGEGGRAAGVSTHALPARRHTGNSLPPPPPLSLSDSNNSPSSVSLSLPFQLGQKSLTLSKPVKRTDVPSHTRRSNVSFPHRCCWRVFYYSKSLENWNFRDLHKRIFQSDRAIYLIACRGKEVNTHLTQMPQKTVASNRLGR